MGDEPLGVDLSEFIKTDHKLNSKLLSVSLLIEQSSAFYEIINSRFQHLTINTTHDLEMTFPKDTTPWIAENEDITIDILLKEHTTFYNILQKRAIDF